ncbi:unnamed protein product [Periconia digitata]|uniref:Uncharacterized protein n=1 Tax=Periconia digitata TaxID=1303443 RepID=A0A9W4UQK1_9PLEO|nr:unnamed protein product [Periconia digitata]
MNDSINISPLARLCAREIGTIAVSVHKSWARNADEQLRLGLGLIDSASRLKEWEINLARSDLQYKLGATDGHDFVTNVIGPLLLSLALQVDPIYWYPNNPRNRVRKELSTYVMAIVGSSQPDSPETLIAYLRERGYQTPSYSMMEAENIINDIVTCLCSYSTALRLKTASLSPQLELQPPQKDNQSLYLGSLQRDLQFKPSLPQRTESDLSDLWRQWNLGDERAVTPQDSQRPFAQQSQSSGKSKPTLSGELSIKKLPKGTTKSKKSQKHVSTRSPTPPPPYELSLKNPPPPFGHVCWMNDTGSPPPYHALPEDHKRKLVIVGPGACGKTCALIVFSKGTFPEVYVPTVFENYVADVDIDSNHLELALWDTAGQIDYDRLRPMSYPDSHVILMAYSVDSPESLDIVIEQYTPEIAHFCAGVPVVLTALKVDLRDDERTIHELKRTRETPVSFHEGLRTAKKIGADAYIECSARTGQGLRAVFEASTRLAIAGSGSDVKDSKCTLM